MSELFSINNNYSGIEYEYAELNTIIESNLSPLQINWCRLRFNQGLNRQEVCSRMGISKRAYDRISQIIRKKLRRNFQLSIEETTSRDICG